MLCALSRINVLSYAKKKTKKKKTETAVEETKVVLQHYHDLSKTLI